ARGDETRTGRVRAGVGSAWRCRPTSGSRRLACSKGVFDVHISLPMAPHAVASGNGEHPPPAAGQHVPVRLDRVLELLSPALAAAAATGRDAVYVDATLGLGGHAEAMLAAHPRLILVGLDRDTEALSRATARLARYAARTHLVHAVYDELPDVLDRLGYPA